MAFKQHFSRRRAVAVLAGAALGAALWPTLASAEAWPAKPVRIIIGAPVGGTADVIARLLADGLQKELGKPFYVDARPGGLGAVAMQDLLSAPRDGHTLLVSVSALVSEVPHLVKPRYDPFNDVKPLVELGRSGLVLVGNPSLPAKNLSELVAWAKTQRGKVSYASYSTGTVSHTLGLELNKAAELDMEHVAYKGSPPALQDVMGGHVPLMFDGPTTSIPMIKAGKLRAFAISGPKRLGALPDVPTFAEQGYPQLDDVPWMGLWLTPDVPVPVQARLREATLKVMSQPGTRAKLLELGNDAGSGASPEDLSRELRAAHDKQGKALRALGIQPQEQGQ
jgi:tripartite-type tricarboxylate transporter receptor subunit TctC